MTASAGSARPVSTVGVVVSFDADAGLGVVMADDGVEVGFHCTQIADGTRRIAAGTPVRFVVLAGRSGRWEAGAVTPEAVAPEAVTPEAVTPSAATATG